MNILKLYQNLSFKRKILLYAASISLFSLILASLAFMTYDAYSIRRLLVQNLLTETNVIGATSASALVFHDPAFASKVLASLEEESRIVAACIYLEDGNIFARYVRRSAKYEFPKNHSTSSYQFEGKYLDIFTPISFEKSQVGTLYIRSDLHELSLRKTRYILIALCVMVLSLVAALLASNVFQRIISQPVLELVKTAKRIAKKEDFSFRATKYYDDELSDLTENFNEMLRQIQNRDSDLRESEERMRSVLETSPVGISIYDETGQCFVVNDSLAKMIAATKEQVLQHNYNELESWKISGTLDKAKSALKENITKRHELIGESTFGQTVRLDCYLVPFSSGRLLFMAHDITNRILAEEALQKANDELEAKVRERTTELEEANTRLIEASQLKSQFLANMSHELRTPLNSIIGFTGIILQGIVGELNDEQKKQLNMVYESAKHLLGLINDILDLSKIEAGKIEIIPAEFEIRELIQTVEKMVFPMIEKKGLTLQVAVSEDVPPTIYNDKNRIKQVLINLLSNAIKFTESGEITLISDFGLGNADLRNSAHFIKNDRAKRYNKSEIRIPQSEIVFSVADTGIGIKPEHLSEIFDEFKQIEGPLKEKPTGTGLGLAISKKMVEMMEGRIWVESVYEKGTCFQFAIPVKEITTAKRAPVISPEALDLIKKLVLTIDDEIEAQEILKTYLKSEGYEVIQAYNAMEAMELAKKYRPFAITLDIMMPGKDGWDILHELKEEPQSEPIPVICISILDNREMGLSLGAFEYLVKPITKEQLMKELCRLEKRFRIYDILIVDDEPQAVELLAQYLGGETNNYRVAKAFGGKEGLAAVKERRPDLIILDLMMPEIDGFEVIRHLKKSEGTKEIPIIIVSAMKLTQEEVEYLMKNFTWANVRGILGWIFGILS